MDFKAKVRHILHKEITKSILWSLLAILVSLVFLFPIFWLVLSSFKTDVEIFKNPPAIFPEVIIWSNYTDQLVGENSILGAAKNSAINALGNLCLSLLLAVPAAYGISRFKVPGGKIILMYFLVTQMLPSSLLLTPLYLNYSKWGILNSHVGPVLAIATVTIPFTLMVLRPMFMACPKEIEEAARIDGCNRGTAFLRVVLPIIKPGVMTCACFAIVHGWNDLVYSLTFNSKQEFFPMTSAIYNLMNEYGIRWNMIMAYGTMLILPPILIFIFGQKYVISGLAGGAVKG